jgi:hypothetical protein
MKKLAVFGLAGLALVSTAPVAHACWGGGFGYTTAGYSYAPRYVGYGYSPYYSGYSYGPRRWAYGYDDSYYYGPGIGLGIYAGRARVGRIDRGDRVVGRAYAPGRAAAGRVAMSERAGASGVVRSGTGPGMGGGPRGMGFGGARGGGVGKGR